MDIDGLKKIIEKIDGRGVDRLGSTNAEFDLSGRSVFNTSRLKFVVDHNDEISRISIYGLQAVKSSSKNSEVSTLFSDVAERNTIGYSDITSLFDVEPKRARTLRYLSFMATPCIDIEGDVEKCVQKIYGAQNDLIRVLSNGGMAAVAKNEMGKEATRLAGEIAKEVMERVDGKTKKGKGNIYDYILWSVDGRRMTTGERLYELGNEMLIYGNSWKDVASQFKRESGLEVAPHNLGQKFRKMEKEYGVFVGPMIRTMNCGEVVYRGDVEVKKKNRCGGRSDAHYRTVVNIGDGDMTVDDAIYRVATGGEISRNGPRNKSMTWDRWTTAFNLKTGFNFEVGAIKERAAKLKKERRVAI